jgi:hypothetical protein
MRRILIIAGAALASLWLALTPGLEPLLALSSADRYCADRFCPAYSNEVAGCAGTTAAPAVAISNPFTSKINQDKDGILRNTRAVGLYKQLEASHNIPWQMFAVIHYRESGGKIANNGATGEGAWGFDGGYQDQAYAMGFDLTASKPLTDREFLDQGALAARIIREKAGERSSKLDKAARSADVIAYTFFGYNGRARFYIDQALQIGLNRAQATNGEGSPYVANYASEKQSPKNPDWRQIINGQIRPANTQVGAWTLFAALAEVKAGGATDCTGTTAPIGSIQRVVDMAKAVPTGLNIQQAKAHNPILVVGSYPNNASWCAVFATQIYKNAGLTVPGGKWGPGIYSWAADPVRFTKVYPSQFIMINPFKGQKAAPGDFIIFANRRVDGSGTWNNIYSAIANTPLGSDGSPFGDGGPGIQHVGIVIAVSGSRISTVEGNTRYPVPNGVTSKNTYNYVPGQSTGWEGQIFGFVRRIR